MHFHDADDGPFLRPESGQRRWPLVPGSGGRPVPDLRRIPRERWRDALRDASPVARRQAAATVSVPEDVAPVLAMIGELDAEGPTVGAPDPSGATERLAYPAALPVPTRPRPGRAAPRQVTFRLGDVAYADLARAADLVEVTPTTLARLLTVRGVRGMLAEERGG